jgi:hypothetical protein
VRNPNYGGRVPKATPSHITSDFRGLTPEEVMKRLGMLPEPENSKAPGPQSRAVPFDKIRTELHDEAVEKSKLSQEVQNVDAERSELLSKETDSLISQIGMLSVESAKQVKKEMESIAPSEVEKRNIEGDNEENESDEEKSKKRKK